LVNKMFNHNYLITYSFVVNYTETRGNFVYNGRVKKVSDLELLSTFIRRSVIERYPDVTVPEDVVIENVYKL